MADRTLHCIVPFGVGGAEAAIAGMMAHSLGEQWDQPVVAKHKLGRRASLGKILLFRQTGQPGLHPLKVQSFSI